MKAWATAFGLCATVAAIFGFSSPLAAGEIARILFVVFTVLAIVIAAAYFAGWH